MLRHRVTDARQNPDRSVATLDMLDLATEESVREYRVQAELLPEELEFYQSYDWCLNPHLLVHAAIRHLGEEIEKLSVVPDGWQIREVTTNTFLLSSGLLNCVDEYLRGTTQRLPSQLASTLAARTASRLVETALEKRWSRRRVAAWRERWLEDLNKFLSLMVGPRDPVAILANLVDRI